MEVGVGVGLILTLALTPTLTLARLLDGHGVAAGRGGEGEDAEATRALAQHPDRLHVGVLAGGLVRLVDDQAHELVRGAEALLEVVDQRLRGEEEEAARAAPQLAALLGLERAWSGIGLGYGFGLGLGLGLGLG